MGRTYLSQTNDTNTKTVEFTKASNLTNADSSLAGYQVPLPEPSGEDEEPEPDYTEHIEPPEQGGEPYVRCEHCGRECLTKYGGRDKFPHKLDCELSEVSN